MAINIAVAAAVAGLANAFIVVVRPEDDFGPPTGPLQPPGWVIGVVWILLFTFLGTARWLMIRNADRPFEGARWVGILLLFCAAYPIYTSGLRNLTVGLAGNVATAAFAVWVALRIRKSSLVAAGLVSTVALWVTFATFLILEQMKMHYP